MHNVKCTLKPVWTHLELELIASIHPRCISNCLSNRKAIQMEFVSNYSSQFFGLITHNNFNFEISLLKKVLKQNW